MLRTNTGQYHDSKRFNLTEKKKNNNVIFDYKLSKQLMNWCFSENHRQAH